MKSQNFEFLRARRDVLADLAGFAEAYAHSDPSSALIKLRLIIEQVVDAIYAAYGLERPPSGQLFDFMEGTSFRSTVPAVVVNKMHAVRKAGNDAAHGKHKHLTPALTLERLRDTFDVALWFHLAIDRGDRAACPPYQPPPPAAAANGKARELLEKLRLADARFEAALAELERERAARAEAERKAEEEAARRLSAEERAARAAEVEAAQAAARTEGQVIASLLAFDEATTRRRLIDQLLIDAGWDVGADGADTEQVRQEVRLVDGDRADYVLHGANGKPVAVIEAKKTAIEGRQGIEQARLYADALERATGQRPVIFATTGLDIYLVDDALGYPPRRVYGFYAEDSLAYLIHQRTHRQPLHAVPRDPSIADRLYQLEAITRVCERYTDKARKALVVQATGTGKTRVAVSLCDVLLRAGWAKRILFLCDRKELRRQADRVFKNHLPDQTRVVVDATTAGIKDKRIYLATYPAMMRTFEAYDVGFFDLVIVDESHRSVYWKYRPLLLYFDALLLGLTATPVKSITHDTFSLFQCENDNPTFDYAYDRAIADRYLVPMRVRSFTTLIRERGFKYSAMTREQQEALEEQVDDAEGVEFSKADLDRLLFNRGTTRELWRALMNEGIRNADGSRPGKTIVFARSHLHAVHLLEVFEESYPQYGSTFCKIIDNQEPRAEQLIDDFKDPANDLTIAISIDMLDTGVDVPEVVNLVFAKPLRSYVKFWQMIGRGTRLCPDLFGPGKHKTEFLILDFWQNFQAFELSGNAGVESRRAPPLLELLFRARIDLARAAQDALDQPLFDQTIELILRDLRATITTNSLEVREHRRALEALTDERRLAQLAPATEAELRDIAAPLQHCRDVRGNVDAYRFDLLVTRLQHALLTAGRAAPRTIALRARVQDAVELLGKHHNPVKEKADAIRQVRDARYWAAVDPTALEALRNELRAVMQYQQAAPSGRAEPLEYDVPDTDAAGTDHTPRLEGLELIAYRHRVEKILRERLADDPVVAKIRQREPVSEADLEDLARAVMQVDNQADVKHLIGYQPEPRRNLAAVFRGLVGLDEAAVKRAFADFVRRYPTLSGQQIQFLQLLEGHLERHAGIALERLYEAPFTAVHADGVDGVFPDVEQANQILAIVLAFTDGDTTRSA